MDQHHSSYPSMRLQVPWNKGKLIGAKPPLRPKHVWSIRTKLQVEGELRDLAMFNLAIDSKLRGCILLVSGQRISLRMDMRLNVQRSRRRKTGQPVSHVNLKLAA